MFRNPGLIANQSPFTRTNLMSFGVAAVGTGLGLVVADFLDRWIATRAPADSVNPASTARNPWYGRDAAAAQRRRPDALRLGGQAAGAVGAMGLAYLLRGRSIFPWLLGGTALGFGSNLVKMLADWWLMPNLLAVKAADEISFANRMYPLEQTGVQDTVAGMFENWGGVPTLAEAQAETPLIQGPLPTVAGEASVYALGKARQGDRRVTAAVGGCPDCAQKYAAATRQPRCKFTVRQGSDLGAILNATGVSLETMNQLNGGGPEQYWYEGNCVTCPYEVCTHLERQAPTPRPMVPNIPVNVRQVEVPIIAPQPMVAGPPPQQAAVHEAKRAFYNFGAED